MTALGPLLFVGLLVLLLVGRTIRGIMEGRKQTKTRQVTNGQ